MEGGGRTAAPRTDTRLEPMSESTQASTRTGGDLAARLQELWRPGQPPHRHDLRAAGGPDPAEVLAVLRADQHLRWLHGQRVGAEQYLAPYPALRQDASLASQLIASEFLLRRALGEAPDPEEYLRRFPEYAGELSR